MMVFSGQRAFLLQRLSALVLLAYVVAAALRLAFGAPAGLAEWRAWAAQPLAAAILLLLAGAVLLHAWVGVRDVVLDYVQPLPLRAAVLLLVASVLVMLGAWTALILVSHAL
ncbi:MAG TPA: succinate dehydrogenase, hydrophobic membrane anchor protein [Burkholderiales bacterium]|nr:succinate dehydrogenase, hydrophobic membrane anchor protein [Burkholderiales bacterium]